MSPFVALVAVLTACGTPEAAPGPEATVQPEAVAEAAPAKADATWQAYGAPFTKSEAMPAGTLLTQPETFVDQVVLVEGRVADVCAKAGCWMVLAEGEHTMRVTMKDHFGVDKQGAGGTAVVEGTVVTKAVDPETVAHYKSESRKPELVPEEGLEHTYELVATAVRMRR